MNCVKHPITTFYLQKTKTGHIKRCRRCNSERVHKCRKNLIRKVKSHFGGKCSKCGYDKYLEVLDFHHIVPGTKEFALSDNRTGRSFQRMLEEARKCELLCSNCHRERHLEMENGE